jgi:hypothetical protein
MITSGRPWRRGRVMVPRFLSFGNPPSYTLRPGLLIYRRETELRHRPGWLLRSSPAPLGGMPALGYNIYGNGGSGPINYSTPIATVYGLTWTSSSLAYPDDWKFGVRAFNSNGEEKNLDASVEIILDSGGKDITLRPITPMALRAFALAGAAIRVEWTYAAMNLATLPTGFNVYIGIGGSPSYGSPVATVSYQSAIAGSFVANLAGLTNGTTYAIGVRSYNATAEEPNTTFVLVTADSAGPASVVSLTASAVAG